MAAHASQAKLAHSWKTQRLLALRRICTLVAGARRNMDASFYRRATVHQLAEQVQFAASSYRPRWS